MIKPFEHLANAIILQAIKDYRRALRLSKRKPDIHTEQRAIEKFLRSNWFSTLSDINPEYLISKLQKEVQ